MTDVVDLFESSSQISSKPNKLSRIAYFILSVTGGTAVMITVAAIPFVSPAFRKVCLPFVPASQSQIFNVLMALKTRSGTVVDLGSGDGRIVRAAASVGFKAIGVELNLWLILYSRFVSLIKGYTMNTTYYRRNLWAFNLRPYNNVVLFGTEEMMPEIENKCRQELQDGSVVVTCRFPLPSIQSEKIIGEGIDTVWRYTITNSKK